jgi:glycosyltransferase involved in cell wall biosynthesis/SAM-dependent methyltransferase
MAANEERESGFLPPVAQSDPVTSAQKTDEQLLSESEFFDAEWYLTANPDVRSAGLDPARHYLDFGASEGKKPGPVFDGEEYLASHADVAAAGINPLVHYLRFGRAEGRPLRAAYRDWLARFGELSEVDRTAIRFHIESLPAQPTISVIVPTYNTDPAVLSATIKSVQAQLYENWQLCIVDDASPNSQVREIIEQYAARDSRICFSIRPVNGGISAASNDAIALTTSDFVGLLDHDDLLDETGLYEVAVQLNATPDADIIYSDCDHFHPSGWRRNPYFKGAWNQQLFYGHNLICHFEVYRRSLLLQAGGFRSEFDGSQDYDLALRVVALTTRERIKHIPAILYHWRRTTTQESYSQHHYEECLLRAAKAIKEQVQLSVPGSEVSFSRLAEGWNRIIYPLPSPRPLVSVILYPTIARSFDRCVNSILRRTRYSSFEIIVAVDDRHAPAVHRAVQEVETAGQCRAVVARGNPNLGSIMNEAARISNGDVLVFVSGDLEVETPLWLDELVALALQPVSGTAGPLVRFRDNTIQHGGIILGGEDGSWPRGTDEAGYFGYLGLAREVSALSLDCLAVRRDVFSEAEGFWEELAGSYIDIDLCLRLQNVGLVNIWTCSAALVGADDAQSVTIPPDILRAKARDRGLMEQRWGERWRVDPLYNANLSLQTFYEPTTERRRVVPWESMKRKAFIRNGQKERAKMLMSGVSKTSRVVEIGASYSPIAPKSEGWQTWTVDHATRNDLVAKYTGVDDVWVERIEEVDVVWREGPLVEAFPKTARGTFDVFLASHVIEHTPNLVDFLASAEALLKPDGTVILAVPDKRYCFDYFRPITLTSDIVEAHLEKRTRHSRRTAFEHHAYTLNNQNVGAWGQAPVVSLTFVNTFDQSRFGMEQFDANRSLEYQDFHVWKFTPSSFALNMAELARLDLTDWLVVDITPAMGCEFHVRLQRGGKSRFKQMDSGTFEQMRSELLRGYLVEMREQVEFAQTWTENA